MIDLNKLQKRFDDLFNDPNMPKDFKKFILIKINMIENTFENKRKFFYLYYGQNVLSYNGAEFEFPVTFCRPNDYLLLKPLSSSSITDEDAIELVKIMTIQDTTGNDIIPFVKLCIETYIDKGYKGIDLNIADFLRSRGYLLPWMGLTPDEIINYGWAKLKED